MSENREILGDKFKSSTGSRIKNIEGACHMLHWDKPHEVVEEILYWLK